MCYPRLSHSSTKEGAGSLRFAQVQWPGGLAGFSATVQQRRTVERLKTCEQQGHSYFGYNHLHLTWAKNLLMIAVRK